MANLSKFFIIKFNWGGRAARARVPQGAGRVLDVAARAAGLRVRGKSKAISEDERVRAFA